MYSNPHATVGLVINVVSQAIFQDTLTAYLVAMPFAIGSHYVLDFVKETHLKDDVFVYDVLPSWIYYIAGFFSGNFLLFLVSWIEGNLFDIIDKKFYLSVVNSKKFPATHYFHKHKTGIETTLFGTKLTSVVCVILFIIISLII
tara:strand:+ start:1668 stop:2099 length:432 start_codon:yes stop_codon:yes gene_type:complete